MTKVVEIVLQAAEHLLHSVGVAVVECGVRCDTRAYLVEIFIAFVVLQDLVDVELALGAWTYECHVANKNIPKLWELIEVVCA